MKYCLLAIVALLLLNSCSSALDANFHSQLVVQGFLYANEPLDSIIVRQTLSITNQNPQDRVSGASVTISTGDSNFVLREDSVRGRYIYTDPTRTFIAQPSKTYHLTVAWNGDTLTAQTTVPKAITLDSAKLVSRSLSVTGVDTIVFPDRDSLAKPGISLWWTPSSGSAGYGLEVICLRPEDSNFISDQNITLSLPDSNAYGRYRFFILSTSEQAVWLQFKYFGLNAIRAIALDKNYQDFILGVYLSSSQFNNATLDVQGGLGVFGSAARASKKIFIR